MSGYKRTDTVHLRDGRSVGLVCEEHVPNPDDPANWRYGRYAVDGGGVIECFGAPYSGWVANRRSAWPTRDEAIVAALGGGAP